MAILIGDYGTNIARGAMEPKIDSVTWKIDKLQIWQPDDTTCIGCKVDHQMASLVLVTNLATKWQNLHYFKMCLLVEATCLLALSVGIELVSSLARVTSVKSTKVAQ